MAERFAVYISTFFKKAARDKWKQTGDVASFGVEANGSKTVAASISGGSKVEANGSKPLSASIPVGSRQEANGSKTVAASILSGSKIEANGSKYPVASILASAVGSNFHTPADINEWDRLTAALFYLKQFHWAVHHLFQPTKGEDKEQGKRPWCKA